MTIEGICGIRFLEIGVYDWKAERKCRSRPIVAVYGHLTLMKPDDVMDFC